MSMNLNLRAKALVTFPSGKKKWVFEEIALVQTPTKVTYEILDLPQAKRLDAYLEWYASLGCDEVEIESDPCPSCAKANREYSAKMRRRVKALLKDGWKLEWFAS